MFTPATRTVVKPLIGLFGKSGGGKTLTALLLGRGLIGMEGKLGLLDTENKRGAMFADIVPGSFLHEDFQPPFHPLEYVKKIEMAEKAGIQCLVVDSMSHEWLGMGGYLDLKEEALQRMVGDNWEKREKCAMAAAAQVKPKTHAKFVQAVLRCNMALILCFRAQEKVRLTKSENGKTKIESDENPSPMQDGDLIFEMLISAEVYAKDGVGGYLRTNGQHCKHTHPSILPILPKDGEQVSVKTGEMLAAWCAGKPTAPSVADPKKIRQTLWTALKDVRGADSNWNIANEWLVKNKLAAKKVEEMTAQELLALLPEVEKCLTGAMQ